MLAVTNLLKVFAESGMGTALIQKKDPDDLDFSSVFFFNLCFSLLLIIVENTCSNDFKSLLAVLDLASAILAVDRDTGRLVSDSDSGVSLIDVLSAGT